MGRWLKGTICFFVILIVLSGQFNIKFLTIGFAVSAIVSRVCIPLFFDEETGEFILAMSPVKLFLYFIWLFWQIALSTISLVPVVLFGTHSGEESVFTFTWEYKSKMAKAILISSIILTPGTVTIDIEKGSIYHIHALTHKAKNDLLQGDMQRKVGELFGEKTEGAANGFIV